jgi:hypothetical protein
MVVRTTRESAGYLLTPALPARTALTIAKMINYGAMEETGALYFRRVQRSQSEFQERPDEDDLRHVM